MGRLLLLVVGLSIAIGLIAPTGSTLRLKLHPAAPVEQTATPAPVTTSVPVTTNSELTLQRDPTGHFNTQASVNGQPLPFVVDTGADIVALTVDDARRIGLPIDPSRFAVIAQGASGPVKGEEVSLDRIEINGQEIQHVRAAVLEGLGQNLLGQSALTRLGGVELKGDRMTLR